jgi:hypothetical protein
MLDVDGAVDILVLIVSIVVCADHVSEHSSISNKTCAACNQALSYRECM